MTLTCAQLLETYPDLWRDATRHRFLDRCQAGTIEPQQFNTWLTQDYLFVTEFTRFLANTLAAAPVAHFDVLLGGLNKNSDAFSHLAPSQVGVKEPPISKPWGIIPLWQQRHPPQSFSLQSGLATPRCHGFAL